MVESKIYIGLNDVNTNTQFFENGEYARETSLVVTLIDVEKAVVGDIAKDLCAFFRQESVLVTESQIQAHFVRETLE